MNNEISESREVPEASEAPVEAPPAEAVAAPAGESDGPISVERLAVILDKHKKWLRGEEGGERANLRSANLTSANLTYADLTYADLTSANLRSANLTSFRDDLVLAILNLPDEIPFLRQAVVDGKIDGTTYTGTCCCLAGTMCHAKEMEFDDFKVANLMPIDSMSPREIWFYNIRPGHTPENSEICKLTLGWIDEALAIVARIRTVKPAETAAADAVDQV